MEEEQDPSKQYIKDFNWGYSLGKFEPELLKNILSTDDKENERIKAMNAGRDQYQREQLLKEIEQAKNQHKTNERER